MAARIKATVAKPMIPGVGSSLRAWLYLIGLIVVAFNTAFGVGNGNQTQVQVGVIVGLLVVFIGAVNTPYELPQTASELVPWLTTERCFWIYRSVAVMGIEIEPLNENQVADLVLSLEERELAVDTSREERHSSAVKGRSGRRCRADGDDLERRIPAMMDLLKLGQPLDELR